MMRMPACLLFAVLLSAGCSDSKDAARTVSLSQGAQALEAVTATDLDPRPDHVRIELTARALEEAHDGLRYAYNGANPGPVIRARVGDTLTVNLKNELEMPTTIHWHGVKVPFEMDGVTWQRALLCPASFEYRFTLTQAGTFWYHPHFNTDEQVDAGLYGALIVEEPAAPVADQEWVLIFDTAHEHIAEPVYLPDGSAGRAAHGHGRRNAIWLVNGEPAPARMPAAGGERVRVRMINASSTGYLNLSWDDIRHIASDQGLLPRLDQPETILLGPGDRADVELLVGGQDIAIDNRAWSLNGGPSYEADETLIEVLVNGPAEPPAPGDYPFTGEAVTPDPTYTDILYVLSGSDRTGIWLINGERFPAVTIKQLEFGQEAIIEVRNLSPTEHPFHLHGLNFRCSR